jgi:DMSO/TMAO reductase YedYZ molybdopterin-dependent catalytic subunit
MSIPVDRRRFLGAAAVLGLTATRTTDAAADSAPPSSQPFLTDAANFFNVSRGNPKPYTLKGEALEKARLTAKSWRLEIVGDSSSEVAHPNRLEDGGALDLAGLEALPQVGYLKAMQCNNIPAPLGQGLWEGATLRDVLKRVGKVGNVRRVYFWGFHNNDPAQLFQSSLAYNRVMETPPWEPPPLVAYRLNGQRIPLERGGPVRMIVPWAHGFKSIKWLQKIVLTNDYKANDTYALENNDPESFLKTAAYLGSSVDRSRRGRSLKFTAGQAIVMEGTAIVGVSGLERVEYWVQPGTEAKRAEDDPAWKRADWKPCELMPPPNDWENILPEGTSTKQIWGFDPTTGKPKDWPLLYSTVSFSAELTGLAPGSYEFRARTVDRNGFAQPEPRPYQKSGMNLIPCQTFVVTA